MDLNTNLLHQLWRQVNLISWNWFIIPLFHRNVVFFKWLYMCFKMIFLLLLCPGSICDKAWKDLQGTYMWQCMYFNSVKLQCTEKVSSAVCRCLLLKKQTCVCIWCKLGIPLQNTRLCCSKLTNGWVSKTVWLTDYPHN